MVQKRGLTKLRAKLKKNYLSYLQSPGLSYLPIKEEVVRTYRVTSSISSYYPIIRKLGALLEVKVYRSKEMEDDQERMIICVVGNHASRMWFSIMLNVVLETIEKQVKQYKDEILFSKDRMHLTREASIKRDRLINQTNLIISGLFLLPQRDIILSSNNRLEKGKLISYYCMHYLMSKHLKIPLRSDYTK